MSTYLPAYIVEHLARVMHEQARTLAPEYGLADRCTDFDELDTANRQHLCAVARSVAVAVMQCDEFRSTAKPVVEIESGVSLAIPRDVQTADPLICSGTRVVFHDTAPSSTEIELTDGRITHTFRFGFGSPYRRAERGVTYVPHGESAEESAESLAQAVQDSLLSVYVHREGGVVSVGTPSPFQLARSCEPVLRIPWITNKPPGQTFTIASERPVTFEWVETIPEVREIGRHYIELTGDDEQDRENFMRSVLDGARLGDYAAWEDDTLLVWRMRDDGVDLPQPRAVYPKDVFDSLATVEKMRPIIPDEGEEIRIERRDQDGDFGFPRGNEKVDHPRHYNRHPSGVECIEIIEHMPANIAFAMKHLWRCGLKDTETPDRDLQKAQWYIARERKRLSNG